MALSLVQPSELVSCRRLFDPLHKIPTTCHASGLMVNMYVLVRVSNTAFGIDFPSQDGRPNRGTECKIIKSVYFFSWKLLTKKNLTRYFEVGTLYIFHFCHIYRLRNCYDSVLLLDEESFYIHRVSSSDQTHLLV